MPNSEDALKWKTVKGREGPEFHMFYNGKLRAVTLKEGDDDWVVRNVAEGTEENGYETKG